MVRATRRLKLRARPLRALLLGGVRKTSLALFVCAECAFFFRSIYMLLVCFICGLVVLWVVTYMANTSYLHLAVQVPRIRHLSVI
jgi:DNA polymerase II large subunit